jgi:hypothetical protein
MLTGGEWTSEYSLRYIPLGFLETKEGDMRVEPKQFHDAETNIVVDVTMSSVGYKIVSPQLLGFIMLPKFVWDKISESPVQGRTTDTGEIGNEWKWKTGDDFVSLTAKNQLCSVKIKIPVTIWAKMFRMAQ